MGREDVIEIAVGWFLMSIVFGLALLYILNLPVTTSIYLGMIISAITVIGHELAHLFTAKSICHIEKSEFILTTFAIEVTTASIVLLLILILLKKLYGLETWFLPILASPGAVYVDALRTRKCGDEVAIAGPLYNFIVGIIGLMVLFSYTKPPFILNHNDFAFSALALTTYFSFALAWFNSLPLKIDGIALDGYHAMTIDPSDKFSKVATIVILAVSTYVVFLSKWWVVMVHA